MRKFLRMALLFASFFICASAMAQGNGTAIKGTVSDDKGVTLPGVTVAVKDGNERVVTNLNGQYNIVVPTGAKALVFTFVGMQRQEILIGNKTTIDVKMSAGLTNLDDVVVIGYGTQKRGDVNGAVSSVSAKQLQDIPQPSIDQMLQGKAAGVTITQNSGAPGSQTSVHIRGITALTGSNEPLYVIDGIPISGDATNSSTSGRSPMQSSNNDETAVSPLSLINPNDIESIDILKDASATAIYGSRAANGVIIITTKRGKSGSSRINYDGYYGFQQQGKFLDMMNLQQYATLQNALADVFQVGRRGEFSDPSLLGEGTNWQKEIFRTAPMQSHQVSVSGGKDGVDYYISGGFLKQEGTVIGSDFNRYTLRTNVNGQVKDWFKLGSVIAVSRTDEDAVLSDNNGIVYNALLSAPDQAVYNADGTFAGPLSNQVGGTINPVAQALSKTNNLVRNNVNGNLYADLRFYKDLTLRSELGGDFNFSDSRLFNPTYSWGIYTNPTATLSESWQQGMYWNWKEYLTYDHTFAKKHYLNFAVGYELSESTWNGISAYRQSFYSNDLQTLNLGDAKTATNDEYKGSSVLQSAYARAIYTFNSKYSLTATIRSDKSSNFAPGHQTGYFPSFAASWRVSDEPFMAKVKQVADNIKLRLGYGQVGNQDIPGYQYGIALNPAVTGLGTGFFIDKIPNPNLTWQTSIQTNAGIDFSLFNGRIDVSFDWYDKTSKNFIFQKPLPEFLVGDATYLGGLSPIYINGGKVDNKGFDFTLNTRNIITKDFRWSSTLIFSHYNNKVTELPVGSDFIIGNITNGFLQFPATKTTVGSAVGEFYGYKVKGIFKTDNQLRNAPIQFGRPVNSSQGGTWLGDIQYADLDHNGKIDAGDQTDLGNPNPKFTYGFTNTFNYKSVELSIFLQGEYGDKILNALNYTIGGLSSLYQNQLASSANFWTPANPNSNTPAPKGGTDNPNLFMSDRNIVNGSYLRIQNVRLGYILPANWIRSVKLTNLKVYASVQNLYTITGYKGLDPEIGSMNQSPFLTNIDLGRYPTPRTITFGVNAQF